MQYIDNEGAERCRARNPYSEVGTYEVTCIHCGQTEILTRENMDQKDVRDAYYHLSGRYYLHVFCELEPMVCCRCGAEWNLDNLRIKKISVQ